MTTFVNTLIGISRHLHSHLEQIQEQKDSLQEELSSKLIKQVQMETEMTSIKS